MRTRNPSTVSCRSNFKRRVVAVLGGVSSLILTLGCPIQIPSVAGAWNLKLDANCDKAGIVQEVLTLAGKDSAYVEASISGVWEKDGEFIEVTLGFPMGESLRLRGMVSGNTMEGTFDYSKSLVTGCWTATRAN
ncbi:MAG: hypothetical protein AMXMBFR84_36580 [Candidatus Hydrogenedentota bacterium]